MNDPRPGFAFVHSPIDRSAGLRRSAELLSAARLAQDTRWVHVRGDGVVLNDGGLHSAAPEGEGEAVFLGQDASGAAWFAVKAADDLAVEAIRAVMVAGLLPPEELSILAQARSLVHWHETHGFCARCGTATAIADGGYRRHCASCEADHFPRTDPVVIMAVVKDGAVLVGRQAAWPAGMYSTLAGFVEPGETLEQAVRREVMEETGIAVAAVRYVASQPWPFPSSLMLGVVAQATSSSITMDAEELEDARWVTAAELRQMLKGQHPQGFYASHPRAIAHHLLQAALNEIEQVL